jgi:Kef-type K+ transport system membrane component KefB
MHFEWEMNIVLAIGILTFIGIFGGFAAKKLNFPTISGYIIVGVALSLLNIIPKEMISGDLDIITDISLGIIGFLVGGGLFFGRLKKFGKSIAIITPFEAIGAWIFVTLPVIFLGPFIVEISGLATTSFRDYIPLAIVLGAISCATAPAASLAIVREYKAAGPFTTTLLAIIVLDDAVAVIAFALGSNFAESLISGFGNISWYDMLAVPIIDIFASIALGVALGFLLVLIGKYIKKKTQLLAIVLGIIFLCIGIASVFGLSSILATMVMGFIVVNRLQSSDELFGVINNIEQVIFAMFFTLAGAHFDYGVIKSAGLLALALVVFRFIGKFVGVRIGGAISKAPSSVKNYLGFGLFPIAGVTIGLAMLIKQHPAFHSIESVMINAILASVIINEIIAPPLTKFAIFRSGEAYKME